ncbi:hypothetical protein HYPSUDRAFT_203388 [Hypholoma sublateritium FD-334 SS-4]|uniref:Uncharacterized protein n=1 Tax=Hypholoma sublateritium (strain FD-334 SS-4) TaxID=945553 RepID=A0A0D2L2N3_HYPSF|nr:hypothetical protein HYPSUDRAFT_203388 [Hypholoma sublateritium FD-334 SS-4]
MALELLQAIFCCHRSPPATQEEQYDETSHLIPSVVEPAVVYTDRSFDYQQYQARMNAIVQANKAKMVNVASASPFNLHNRDISVDASASPHPRSESPEDKQVYYHSRIFFDVYPNRNSARNRKRYPYPSIGADQGRAEFSDEVGGNDAGKPSITEQPAFWPIPIINARTIGLAESSTKGWTVDRVPQPFDLPSSTAGTGLASTSVQSPDSDNAPQKPIAAAGIQFVLDRPLIVGWEGA